MSRQAVLLFLSHHGLSYCQGRDFHLLGAEYVRILLQKIDVSGLAWNTSVPQ